MPASFLARHRTICEVLYELKELHKGDATTNKLCDEAILYARRMSLKLTEYKQNSLTNGASDGTLEQSKEPS